MNTEKPGDPFYFSVDETQTSTNNTPDGISSAERQRAYNLITVKMRYHQKRVNRHGCVFTHLMILLIYVLLGGASDGGDGPMGRYSGDPRRGGDQRPDWSYSGE